MKVIDVDEYLKDRGIKIVLKGKEYVVRDIPLEVQEILREDPPDYVKAVSMLLGESEDVVKEYGVVALSFVVRQVYENLLEDVLPSQPTQ